MSKVFNYYPEDAVLTAFVEQTSELIKSATEDHPSFEKTVETFISCKKAKEEERSEEGTTSKVLGEQISELIKYITDCESDAILDETFEAKIVEAFISCENGKIAEYIKKILSGENIGN